MKANRTLRRGFMVADALTGLFLVVALAVALTAALSSQRRAAPRLADERQAVRVAERELLNLQTGAAPQPTLSTDVTVEMKSLAEPAAPSGKQWARVTARVRGREANLVGLVPRKEAR